jgi:DHA2 family multidrug resistance protein
VWWELRHKDPVLKLGLLRERNLGAATLTMFLFGVVLYGSTTLLPIFMQTLLHYTALLSGLAISPGGIATVCMLPLVGFLLSRVDARWMITAGIVLVIVSLFMMSRFSLDVDFRRLLESRVVQAMGFGLLFVPINTVAYAYVAKEVRNDASSLISVARNIGGSIGIAVATSLISRHAQGYQTQLVAHLTPYDPGFMEQMRDLTTRFASVSGDRVLAQAQAYGSVLGNVRGQSAALAFVDVFQYFAFLLLLIIPVTWMMRRPPRNADGTPGH